MSAHNLGGRPTSVADWTIAFERIFPPDGARKRQRGSLPATPPRQESSAPPEAPAERLRRKAIAGRRA
jgi:hypothetical protein